MIQVSAGGTSTCILSNLGGVHCWGRGLSGRLGYGNITNIGDDELPSILGDVSVGGSAVQVSSGDAHSCALLSAGDVVCWGEAAFGQLGYGNTADVGDNELPSQVGVVNVGGFVNEVVAGGSYSCALLETGAVRCWGAISSYGNTTLIGDDEDPASAGDVPLF